MAKYSRAMIDQLKDNANIEYVISTITGQQIQPKANFACINPAHEDKSPSMHIYGQKCHCFACGYTADSIGVIQAVEGKSFSEAVERLAEIEGSPSWFSAEKTTSKRKRPKLYITQQEYKEIGVFLPQGDLSYNDFFSEESFLDVLLKKVQDDRLFIRLKAENIKNMSQNDFELMYEVTGSFLSFYHTSVEELKEVMLEHLRKQYSSLNEIGDKIEQYQKDIAQWNKKNPNFLKEMKEGIFI